MRVVRLRLLCLCLESQTWIKFFTAGLAFNEATHSHDIIDQMSKFTAWKHELDTNPHIFSRKDWQTLATSRELGENVSVTVFPPAYNTYYQLL